MAAVNEALGESRRAGRGRDGQGHGRHEHAGHVLMAGTLEPLARLLNALSKLPGVGKRSALRLSYHILEQPEADVRELAEAIWRASKDIRNCSVCGNYSAGGDLPHLRGRPAATAAASASCATPGTWARWSAAADTAASTMCCTARSRPPPTAGRKTYASRNCCSG